MSIHNADKLLAACKFALEKLNTLTTAEYSKGGDKEVRQVLKEAIDAAAGYHPGSLADPRD